MRNLSQRFAISLIALSAFMVPLAARAQSIITIIYK